MRILSTMGLAGVLGAFGPDYQAATGVSLETEFMPTVRLLERIHAGERGDLAILTADGIDELVAAGLLDGRTDLGRSYVGVAVKAGTPHPDITTADAFVATLLAAQSVAVSEAGASGIYMAKLLARLGIADAMRAKTTVLARGFTAELAASGAVEIAIQQVSELMVVDGVEIVGRLPAALDPETVFSAGRFLPGVPEAAAFIAALAAPALDGLYRRCGLEPAGTGGANRA